MYAYAVVPDSDDPEPAHCNVDTFPQLALPAPDPARRRARTHMELPDVCLSPQGRELWVSGPEMDKGWLIAADVRDFLQEHGAADRLTRWPISGGTPHDSLSVPLLASVYLGSTAASLWDDATGAYFQLTKDHLTGAGRRIHDALEASFGRVMLLTFLDT